MKHLIIKSFAKTKLIELLNKELNGTIFRISVDSGGCAGLKYLFSIDTNINKDDISIILKKINIIIDSISLSIINGGTLEYTKNMMGSNFTLNPIKTSVSCGCGSSFSI